MSTELENLATIRAYLAALESGAHGEQLARFFVPDAVQIELPNLLNPNGASSDLATILTRAEQGRNAHFAMFFEMADGRIRLQRNYDCFEPFDPQR